MNEEKGRPVDSGGAEPCREIEAQLVFYACDELEGEPRAAVEMHLRTCAACAAALDRERRLLQTVTAAAKLEPSAVLLTRCRNQLNDALDVLEPSGAWHGLRAIFKPARWAASHPAWSAALLLLVGVVLGRAVPVWLAGRIPGAAQSPRRTAAVAELSDQDLRNVDVSAIDWQPGNGNAPPNIEVHLMAEKPLVVRGTVNNSEVRRLLLYVVQNERRFDSGERLDSVELLKSSNSSSDVRHALCSAARHDQNPGVRLKALEALRGLERDAGVRQTLLDALVHDTNPGVRIEAVNALREMVEEGAPPSDTSVRRVLEDRMQNDPNTYIRLQSAAAIRQLGPRESY